jgi:hypothetical protein
MIPRELPPTTHVRVLPSAVNVGLDRELVGVTGVIQRHLSTLKRARQPFDWIVETLCIIDLDAHHQDEDGTVITQLWLAPQYLEPMT